MSLDAELVLPPDVEIFSVRELAPQVRGEIDATDEDYAISRRRSRAPSRIIDRDSADLLESFRAPVRIVDAILSFAGKRGLDPEGTLEQAYPLLHYLYQSHVLVPADSDSGGIESELQVGGEIEGFRLLRCVQVLDDNEVFLGRNAAGQYAAVKFYRKANERIARTLEHEAAMLRRVPGQRAPEVYCLASLGSGMALATEWIFGSDATVAAVALRRQVNNRERLLALCVDIAFAFADLHDGGVIHGDVHPRNVLVDGRGAARLIDFGLARAADETNEQGQRGGVAFYFDPEFAHAQRTHTPATLTKVGEQYSVGALLYQLWTGVYYVDWSLERDDLLQQILEDEPVSFEARSVPAWPALESVLRRALEKRPERRFPTMRTFAEELQSLLPEAAAQDRNTGLHHKERAREMQLLDRALRRYAIGGDALRDGLSAPPFASINYGAAGIAYALYRIARLRGDSALLAAADVWAQHAYTFSPHAQAFYDSSIEITPDTVGEVSLFHSASGLHCVRALVSIAMGDLSGANQAIQSFVSRSRGACKSYDLTVGRASLLIGCSELLEAMPAPGFVDTELVRKRGHEIAEELAGLFVPGEMAASMRVRALGVAHGWAGLLFALLRWARASGTEVSPVVGPGLDELIALAEPHGSGLRWTIHNSTSSASYMEGWCNGAAGHAMLFALAYDLMRFPRFAETAERAALSAWAAEVELGTLCCGLGGISYALLAAHRMTGSDVWLDRARIRARRAAGDSSKYFLRDALYKGAVGVAVLAEDLKEPQMAAMPLFESEVAVTRG